MTTPANRDHQSPLEAALLDVHATLAQLLSAADEQYEAVVARDRDRIESVTRQQERLSAQLARAEARRMELLGGAPLSEVISELQAPERQRVAVLRDGIASAVQSLKRRQSQTARLLEQSVALTMQTLTFLQRLVAPPPIAYGARGLSAPQRSVLVDTRA